MFLDETGEEQILKNMRIVHKVTVLIKLILKIDFILMYIKRYETILRITFLLTRHKFPIKIF